MSLRLGILDTAEPAATGAVKGSPLSQHLFPALRKALKHHHLRLEVLPYASPQALQFALENKEIHAVCVPVSQVEPEQAAEKLTVPYALNVRIPRLYEILDAALPIEIATVSFSRALRLPSAHQLSKSPLQNALEGQS